MNKLKIYLIIITLSSNLGNSQNSENKNKIESIDRYRVEYPYQSSISEKVYFTDNLNGKKRIVSVNEDIKEMVFENDTLSANHICIAPNGNKMVFTGISKADIYDLYEYDFTTKRLKQLTKTDEVEFHPKYASDGMSIIYNKQLDTLDLYEIYKIDLNTLKRENISRDTTFSKTFASLNPKMSKMVYVQWHENMNTEIYVSDADGKNPENISNNALFDGWPCWSPDGKTIVFASDRNEKFKFQLYTYGLLSKEIKQITDDEFSYVQPVYSHDGQHIIAVRSFKRGFPNQLVKITL
ncbi:MAG: hypothetical protein ACR2MS_05705 [Weeksellaceae bacterium]